MQITVDTARLRWEDMTVLRDIARLLAFRPFRFHISGVAPCLWQRFLGGSGYTQLLRAMARAPVAAAREEATGRFLLPSCRHCQVRSTCEGPGKEPEAGTRLLFRLRKQERLEVWKAIRFEDSRLNDTYQAILRHVKTYDNPVADREIVFARTYSVGRPAQYIERFIYLCSHMRPMDMRAEKRLLCRLLESRDHAAGIFERYYERSRVSTVHSTFTAGASDRETLYIWLSPADLMRAFAEEKGIPLQHNAFERPYLISVDFSRGEVSGYKLYCLVSDVAAFRPFFEQDISPAFGAWFWNLTRSYEFTRRFDANGQYAGCKIGFVCDRPDAIRREALARFGMDIGLLLPDRVLHSYSLDVSPDGRTDRATVYERPRYKGIDDP